jgi:hypothetical protein
MISKKLIEVMGSKKNIFVLLACVVGFYVFESSCYKLEPWDDTKELAK